MPKERKLGEVFKTPWGKLKVVENKNRNGDLCVFGPCYYCCYDPGDKEFKKVGYCDDSVREDHTDVCFAVEELYNEDLIQRIEAFKQEFNLSGKETINEARDMIAKKQKKVVNKELIRLLRSKNYLQEFINAYKYCRNLSELNGLAFRGTLEGYMVKPEKSKLAYFVGEEDGIKETYIGKFAVLENKLIILNITSKRTNNLPKKNNEELR